MKHSIGELVLYKRYNEITSVGTITACRIYPGSESYNESCFYTIEWNPPLAQKGDTTHESESKVDRYRKYYLESII